MERISLVDYPGLICTTLFTAGCNFHCPWCYNQDLIQPEVFKNLPDIDAEDVKNYLIRRRDKIQAVTVTGGEPSLLWDELAPFFQWCQEQGLKCKIDTNGYRPDIVKHIIDSQLVDYIAMDIKNIWSKYSKTVDVPELNISRIQDSIHLIQASGIDHQFRCTMIPKWVVPQEMDVLEQELGEPIVRQDYLFI